MDPFEIDTIKAEKAIGMNKCCQIPKIAVFFRFLRWIVEAFLVLFFFFWFSARLPIALKLSGHYFRHIFFLIVSPRFVFVVGNAIVLTLVAKSGHFSAQTATADSPCADLYDEFLKNTGNRLKTCTASPSPPPREEIVYEDKAVCVVHTYTVKDNNAKRQKRRSFSERSMAGEKIPELRRSETELVRKGEESGERLKCLSCPEVEMSNEEFRRKIEAFIAKQQRFQREESMAVVLQNQS